MRREDSDNGGLLHTPSPMHAYLSPELTSEGRTGVTVGSVQEDLLTKLTPCSSTPPCAPLIPEPETEEVVPINQHDQKDQQRTPACAQETPEVFELVCEYTPWTTGVDSKKQPEERTLSPWVDGLGWYSQIKKLEQRMEVNKKYEQDVDEVERRFVESAVMIPPSDMDVRIHAEAEGTEISGTWFFLRGKLPSFHAWIGLFPVRSAKSYSDFMYARGTGGEFCFRGVTPGHYQVRLFGNKFLHSQITETTTLVIGPKVETLTARVRPDDHVLFRYNFTNSSSSSLDWIGIYEPGQKRNESYLSFGYGNPHGLVQLPLPHKAGVYEARLFAAGSKYNDQAVVEFTVVDNDFLTAEPVAGGVLVKWSMKRVAPSCSDWIGVYKAGERSAQYLTYAYTNGATNGEHLFRFRKNFPKGSYQVRIFAAKAGKYLSHGGCNFIFS